MTPATRTGEAASEETAAEEAAAQEAAGEEAAGEPAGESEPLVCARAALDAACRHLRDLQSPEGWWKGELQTNVTMDAEDLLLREFLGVRDPGQTATGDVRQSTIERLNRAGRVLAQDPAKAIDLYDEVLHDDADNVEALTYKGWAQVLSGQAGDGLTSLIAAATTEPTYPDVHAFLAIVFFRSGLLDQASRELDRLDSLQPPSQIRQLTDGLRAQVDAARASTTTTAAVPPG